MIIFKFSSLHLQVERVYLIPVDVLSSNWAHRAHDHRHPLLVLSLVVSHELLLSENDLRQSIRDVTFTKRCVQLKDVDRQISHATRYT